MRKQYLKPGINEYNFTDPNPNKPEITNYKHQITNKSQIAISKSQIRSKANCLEF
jgi:hypothetical protein